MDKKCRDHPRLRGEKVITILSNAVTLGSPPLTRGKVTNYIMPELLLRITPAYAGKSYFAARLPPAERDHPRLRGEKLALPAGLPSCWGSPPLTRGKVCMCRGPRLENRITPAYAGKRLNTVAKRSHIICSYPVFYCISFDILPPPFNCSYSLLVISQSFSARCGFIFCQPKYLASVVSW